MSPEITCPHCKKSFPMEEGLSSHLKSIESDIKTKIKDENSQELKTLKEKIKHQEEENKSIKAKRDGDIKKKVQEGIDQQLKLKDKEYKDHYKSLFETKFQERTENLNEQNSEKQKLWKLKENRLIATIEDLQKKATQGTTVDQGSSSEMQLGDFLKKIFQDKQDNIAEYAKGVAGGDWLHDIKDNDFTLGKILYERKNTKSWSNSWITKIQDDMKDSKSDVGIIFTKAVPKNFPKEVQWDHKGNIFICKYDFTALRALATMQRWYLSEKNKQNQSDSSNVLSAIKFIEKPEVTNILMQQINMAALKRKKLDETKKKIDDLIDLNDESDSLIENLLNELEEIGLDAFLLKWKKNKK